MVSRVAVLGLILLSASACSRLPNVPTAYSSLPPITVAREAPLAAVASPTAPAVSAAALPVIRIPGTALARETEVPGQRVNPTDVLAASTRARLAWQPLHPVALTRPSFVANRNALAGVAETGALGTSNPVAKFEAQSYDREAMMTRLEKAGRSAAKPICSGC